MTLPIEPDHRAYPFAHEGKIVGLGLTKREYFAAIALQGLLANPVLAADYKLIADDPHLAYLAVNYADRLIIALNK